MSLAHVQDTGRGRFRLHGLDEHLRSVERRAGDLAEKFGAGDWGRLAGLWHDLGKFQPAFQSYIRRESGFDPEAHLEGSVPGRVDHSSVGALHAVAHLGKNGDRGAAIGQLLAYVIAGHHAGLPDWSQANGGAGSLEVRLRERGELLDATTAVPAALPFLAGEKPRGGPPCRKSLSLWVRLLFSALVDADFLDTEEFMDPERARARARSGWTDLRSIAQAFDRFMLTKVRDDTEVNRIRGEILTWCRDAAHRESGLFSLTVPTGGGKTLSSMAFALRHALCHGKRRIVYVIPYTSILEQTVDVFREALGEGDPWTVVLEHHSNLDPDRETVRGRLAAENWDAPIIVTTSVQFFESLFADRTSRARKLHNLVGSVVVLDEVQLLNADFLHPILDVLQFLVDEFGVTVLLMTATRPSWSATDAGGKRLRGVREIVPDPDLLHESLRRVRVRIPRRLDEPEGWDEVARRMLAEPSVLCVVNRREDARELFLRVRREDATAVHLSALMCGAHRSDVIRDVKERLGRGEDVRVVSTQLVEAGVDLDFPVVFRALAGLDSVAQAAGRCNREGRNDRGEVYVFVPPTSPPPGILRQAADVTRSLFAEGELDPLAPSSFDRFFRHLYWLRGDRLDKEGIRRLLDHDGESERLEYAFRTAGSRFRLIDDRDRVSVVVRWPGPDGDPQVESALRDLEHGGGGRGVFRRLQRAVVGVSRRHLLPLEVAGAVEEIHDRLYVQRDTSLYDDVLGLAVNLETARNPEDLIG